MTDWIRSLLIVHYDMHMAKALAGLVVKEHDVYIYLASIGARVREFLQNIGIDLVIASQELPDMTGTELFADLSRSHPDIVRVLLLSGDEDVDAEEAVRRGLIHHYIVEPIETSSFMNILKANVQKDSMAVPVPGEPSALDFVPALAPEEKEPPIHGEVGRRDGEQEAREEIVLPSEDALPIGDRRPDEEQRDAEETTVASLYDTELDEDVPSDLLDEQERLLKMKGESSDSSSLPEGPMTDAAAGAEWPLESDREPEIGGGEEASSLGEGRPSSFAENGELRRRIEELQAENAALLISARREEAAPEEGESQLRDKEVLAKQVAWMEVEIERLQAELRNAQEQLDQLASMSKPEATDLRSEKMQYRHGPMDIYLKAEELDRQLIQSRQSYSLLTLSLRSNERELADLREEAGRLRKSLDDGRKGFQRELREYQKNCAFLKRGMDSYELRCKTLERENAELMEKLSWVQDEWNQLLESHKVKRQS